MRDSESELKGSVSYSTNRTTAAITITYVQETCMKKSVLSLAVLAALAIGGAHAQTNVQVYGLIDAGVESLNHANATQGSVVKVISGGKNTSRWGLRGTEELG